MTIITLIIVTITMITNILLITSMTIIKSTRSLYELHFVLMVCLYYFISILTWSLLKFFKLFNMKVHHIVQNIL